MDDIVVSGISGRLPESDNLEEFWDHLINKDNLVTEDNRRWEPGLFGLPRGNGKMKDLSQFDAVFFGVHAKQANTMDPQLRMLLEVSYEAILDAGVDPQCLRGSNTGVYIGCSGSEATQAFGNDPETLVGYSITGTNRTMLANRLSYILDLKGPSYAVDTACSSSFLALHLAMQDIREGRCDAAIVGGVSMLLKPQTSLQFLRLGVLSPDGLSKSFDSSGNGYCRSEAIVAVLITKKSLCKRAYCDLVNSGTNTDGYKEQGVTFPSGPTQTKLVSRLFTEASINPNQVEYFEAHGTGTKVGDPEEVNGIASVFCQGRTPDAPLLIGSVKSNMGHSEASSGLAALAKVILTINKGIIPPNLHFNSPNPAITALVDGRMKVVTEPTQYHGGYIGINSFGFGGSNVHIIVRPSNVVEATPEALAIPRLVTCAGRTEDAIMKQLETVGAHKSNQELLGLMDGIAATQNMLYRGFAIVDQESNRKEEIGKISGSDKRPIWYVFSGMGSQWPGMGRDLMSVDTFHDSIERSHKVIQAVDPNVDVYRLLTNGLLAESNTTINNFVGIASIQVALVDCLKTIGLEPDGIVGHSVGELGCAYSDGSLTAEETVLAAYWRGRCVRDANLAVGAMAAVGLTWDEAKQRCPPGTIPACHNTEDTVTISGELEPITKFVEQLQEEGIFAKMVDSSGVAFHSPFMSGIAPALKAALEKVITSKQRSSKWISTSIPESNWASNLAQHSSAAYHVNNLVSPVLFKEGLDKIPANAITIEIGPHCLLQAILRRSLSSDCEFISLMSRKVSDNVNYFLTNIGKLHVSGAALQVSKLYPAVTFPVSRHTPSIAPSIRWDHSQQWEVPTAQSFLSMESGTATVTSYTIDPSEDSPDHYVLGHCIDGRVLYPATGYLCLAWRTLARMHNTSQDQLPVEFRDVTLHQATIMPREGPVTLEVRLAPASNTFEIANGDQLAVTGKIFVPEEPLTLEEQINHMSGNGEEGAIVLSTKDAYKELRLRGYEYGGLFQGIVQARSDGTEGVLSWQGNWVSFTDTMLQISILQKQGRILQLPTRIRRLAINPTIHPAIDEENTNIDIPVTVDKTTNTCKAGGIQIQGMHATVAPHRHGHTTPPTVESYSFVPNHESNLRIQDKDVLKYQDVCSGYLEMTQRGVREKFQQAGLEMPDVGGLWIFMPNTSEPKKISVEKINQYLGNPKCGYLQLLHSINSLDATNDFSTQLDQLKADMADLLANDMLLKTLLKGPQLKNCLDIVWENVPSPKLKVVELGASSGRLFTKVIPLLNSQPTTQLDYTGTDVEATKLSEATGKIEAMGAKVAEWNIATSTANGLGNADLIVADNLTSQIPDVQAALHNITSSLKDGGFFLLHEVTMAITAGSSLNNNANNSNKISVAAGDQNQAKYLTEGEWKKAFDEVDLEVVAQKSDGILSSLFLCRKRSSPSSSARCISVGDRRLTWVDEIKEALMEEESESEEKIWLIADGDQYNGVVGFVNCLKQEPGGHRIRCIFNASMDGSSSLPDLSPESQMMRYLQTQDLLMNVYRDGEWGSYRHTFLEIDPEKSLVQTSHAYANVLTRGDLSTLSWIASPLTYLTPSAMTPDQTLCTVYYASLNFRDIMLATGKLPPDALPANLAQQDNILGLEFSGRNQDGRRIMGLVHSNSLATTVTAYKHLLFDIPEHWSLEEAATVPVVYSTAYYALVVRGQLRKGETVLIHSGSGGVGQAAIAIALSYGCRVFTTVGTPEKRAFLKQKFPQLTDECFANSRDLTFEPQILRATNGKGVDIILNSLAAEKLEASLRVLAVHGRFLEIGKYDLSQNTALGMALFLRNTSFHGVHLDRLMDADNPDWPTVAKLLQDGIANGVVTPLNTTVFEREDVESAFRFMAQGKHIGKVLIKVREEESESSLIPSERKVLAVARNTCHPERVYIITGGLGGFGLELANWLVERGAKKLVLTSRSGVKSGYQTHCIARWQSQGVEVTVSKRDVCQEDEARRLIEEALEKGPVGGVFNLAMVLKDGFFDNQSPELFQAVCAPKRDGTLHLDKITRQLCDSQELQWFVMFSSVSCGRGNAGQTNYGFANSTMERVCEKRRHDGHSGLAIQWGVIGDVGVAMETMGSHDIVVSGCVAQRMSSCLSILDAFLSQPNPVVSSFVPAEKASSADQGGAKVGLVESVAHILGVTDASSLSRDATLGYLGLDSLMGVEVKQTLERDYNIAMNMREIRQLTIQKLDELSSTEVAGSTPAEETSKVPAAEKESTIALPTANVSMVIPHNDTNILIKLNQVTDGNPVYMIHPIEGTITPFEALSSQINAPCFAVQCSHLVPTDSIQEMVSFYLRTIIASKPSGPIRLVGYSFGACVAFEMALQIKKNDQGLSLSQPLILLDGSPDFVTVQTKQYINEIAKQKSESGEEIGVEAACEVGALCAFVEQIVSTNMKELMQDLATCKDQSHRISHAISKIQETSSDDYIVEDLTFSAKSLISRIKASYAYQVEAILGGDVKFLRASQVSSVMKAKQLEEDYGLKKIFSGTVSMTTIPGDHSSILKGDGIQVVADIINEQKQK